jgi:phage terminase large subunit GpA-like protein
MSKTDVSKIYLENLSSIIETSFDYKSHKEIPSEWVEKNMYIPSSASKIAGFASYSYTPYVIELINHLHGTSPAESVTIMKCAQSGFTTMLIVAGIVYTIAEDPAPIFFMAETDGMAKSTIADRFDPILYASGLKDLIKPNVEKRKNNSTGDTALKKQFGGGSLIISGANPGKLRQFSVKKIFADDLDAAPRSDRKEGSIVSLLKKRATSYGDSKKLYFISTPTVEGASNIEEIFLKGDQRKWHWECPSCKTYIPIEWRVEMGDNEFGGIMYELDEKHKLVIDSIYYKCQCCGGRIEERDKKKLNIKGKWIATAEPERPNQLSYQLNALVIPSSFDGWQTLVYEWLEACPPGEAINQSKLKVFKNTRLGQTYKEQGKTPRVNDLMNNLGSYKIGVIPDLTVQREGNGKIALLTVVCDLGGIMEQDNEDVRIDYEIVAHTTSGVTYSIDHGSIGTFIRSRQRTRRETRTYAERTKWTYKHNVPNSAWTELKKIIDKKYMSESGNIYEVDLTLVDSGHFTKFVYEFIKINDTDLILAIRGYGDKEFRNVNKDTPIITRGKENVDLYILQVNQIKDMLSDNMKLKIGVDGYQPSGFMNYPMPEKGKYNMKSYFKHFESEHRIENKTEDDRLLGFMWRKKHSDVVNHFWDVRVYTVAAPHIYIDICKRFDNKKYGKMDWQEYCYMISQE